MTSRVCPVHGEYAPDGVCRWCEKPSGADQSTITLPLGCICQKCLRMFDASIPLTSLICPECRSKDPAVKAKAARMLVLREAVVLADWRLNLRAPISWRIEYADPARVAARDAAEESRLLAQHAALRWERVARRWATKHPREFIYVTYAWVPGESP